MGVEHELAPALGLDPVREQPDARALDAEHRRRVRRSHEGELDEDLRAHVGVGADVEQRHRAPRDGQRQRERRPVDAGGAAHVDHARRKRNAGRAIADERLRPTVGDRARGLDDRRLGVGANGPDRVTVLRDREWRVDDLDAVARLADQRRRPEQQTATPCAAASRAPAATSAGPRSAPLASTATTVMAQGGRDRGRARAERRPRDRRRSRRPCTRDAGAAGYDSAGTRSASARPSCAATGASRCGCVTVSAWGPASAR